MKRILLLFSALMLSCIALWAHDVEIDDIYYDLDTTNKTAEVMYFGSRAADYDEYRGSVTIPETITYNSETYSVTSIGYRAFYGYSGLTSVTIPNSVTSIGYQAFSGCSGLTSVTIPNSVTSIGESAFSGCSGLTSVTIPNSVTYIGHYAFCGCSGLTSVTIPNSVTYIGKYAFCDCSGLTSVTIPNSVTYIGQYAFYNCSGLTSVTIGNSVSEIYSNVFEGCCSLTSVVWNAKNCKDYRDFSYSPFYNIRSNITSFTFGNEVEHIPAYLCYGMSKLTEISIPNSVTTIGKYSFYDCNLISITIPNNVTFIGASAFEECFFNSIVWNAKNCKDFEYNSSQDLYPPFWKSTSYWGCSITLGNEVEHIPAYLCYNQGFKEITIPKSVTSIGQDAFCGNTSLKKIDYLGCIDEWVKIDFMNAYSNPTIYAYELHINNELLTDAKIKSSDSIKNYVFYNCSKIKSIEIGNSVTSIGSYAFQNCEGLSSVTIPNSVTSISQGAFEDCDNLSIVKIGNSVTSIGSCAFQYCEGLSSVTIPNSVTSISQGAFANCYNLSIVKIGNSVTSIESNTFAWCNQLTSIFIGESVESINNDAFEGCGNLKKITMYPTTVPSVYENSFAHYNAYLYVPCAVYEDYDLDDVFGNFKYIKCIAADEVDAPDKVEIDVDNDNNATITWPSTDGAKSYELEITKNGNVFCTLLFNEDGQLTSIDFGNRAASVGFQFTVTGLNGASKYNYSMVAMDKKGNELQSYKGTFTTNGYVPGPGEEDDPSAIIENLADANITVSGGMISADKEFSIYNTLGKDVTALNGSLQPGIYVVVLGEDRVKVMVK